MKLFIIFVVICIAIYLIANRSKYSSKWDLAEKAELDALNLKIQRRREIFQQRQGALRDLEFSIYNSFSEFFSTSQPSCYSDYAALCQHIYDTINSMVSVLPEVKQAHANLATLSPSEDVSTNVSINKIEEKVIPLCYQIADGLAEFGTKVYRLPTCCIMDIEHYGKTRDCYLSNIRSKSREKVIEYIAQCDRYLSDVSVDFEHIFTIDAYEIIDCIWFLATEKNFSATEFEKARRVFSRIYKRTHADYVLSDLYIKNKIGGEKALCEPIQELLKQKNDARILTQIASGLMYMNAYETELIVLQYMLAQGLDMSPKAQERLYSLSNGGGNIPTAFNVTSSSDKFYFDISSLAWNDDEYSGLFESFAFQERFLTYSLAVRDENKDLFIPQGFSVPSITIIEKKFKDIFAEEYDDGIAVQPANCVALSGSGKENLNGILVVPQECAHMGILIHIAKIGKKLIIKFYTLFIPIGSDLTTQRQQCLSMYKKLSPSVSMWEDSLKDTILLAMEQLLNSPAKNLEVVHNDKDEPSSTEPIF